MSFDRAPAKALAFLKADLLYPLSVLFEVNVSDFDYSVQGHSELRRALSEEMRFRVLRNVAARVGKSRPEQAAGRHVLLGKLIGEYCRQQGNLVTSGPLPTLQTAVNTRGFHIQRRYRPCIPNLKSHPARCRLTC